MVWRLEHFGAEASDAGKIEAQLKAASSLSDWAFNFYVPAILLRIERLSLLKIIPRLRMVAGGRFPDTGSRSKQVSKALSRG